MDEKHFLFDLKFLIETLFKEKIKIIVITIIFTLVGIVYAFNSREEFVSEGKLLPEISALGSSNLGGLANLVGIGGFELGMKNNTDAIRPDLYPNILKSNLFFLTLLKQEILNKDGIKLNFEKFYHYTIEENENVESKYLTYFKGKPNGVLVLNRLNEIRIEDLKDRIIASIDKKSGVITISVKMPDPVVAAGVAKFSIDYLTDYVTDYRTEKARNEVDFLGEKVAASKGKFYSNQERKARYSDQFSAPTIRFQTADVQRERIESEYRISSTFYNELLKKYEEAKIKLQQETPVFKIYDPPAAPNKKSEPFRALIVFISFLMGLFFSSAGILFYFIIRTNR
ncbi:lipopolysaccharide biosynthesis protein [Lacihabitans sp. LS3-19]|uniref:Wzz/FepE/Etk N-terminal domain-containing protein n=1 Tax=Lacihabitans sp. LS3-19 TaxID=2487335 RepID=UPI0020CC8D78|nr:Wzz/FepE/Etk N-terminal domain-containing protein [Lacihabitans sp. LS3-19]MCP9769385.1 lipopolysaccharide biosynthesis protein [Lacihabitans sp. LS3-19]